MASYHDMENEIEFQLSMVNCLSIPLLFSCKIKSTLTPVFHTPDWRSRLYSLTRFGSKETDGPYQSLSISWFTLYTLPLACTIKSIFDI
ncbi:hypothetical protein Avbf_13591 [Armadillidium vulgare]|nr:hypothetical protein Avbf_13591 [Armadillidium vulgare]